jgi:hypothetical protein
MIFPPGSKMNGGKGTIQEREHLRQLRTYLDAGSKEKSVLV